MVIEVRYRSFPVGYPKSDGFLHVRNFQLKTPVCMHKFLECIYVPFEFQVLLWMNLWAGCWKLAPHSLHQHLTPLLTEHTNKNLNAREICCRQPTGMIKGGAESSVHAAISLLVAISNATVAAAAAAAAAASLNSLFSPLQAILVYAGL